MRSPARIIVALIALAFAPAAVAAPGGLSVDETARLLAGLSAEGAALDDSRATQAARYAKEFSDRWRTYDRRIASVITKWAAEELESTPGETIYYPFAGPDLPTVHALYPDAGRFILVALQVAGPVPRLDDMTDNAFRWFMNVFRRGWVGFSRRGYFLTNDMKRDMHEESVLGGITPVLLGFASRLGFEVRDITPIRLAADGSDVEVHPGDRGDRATWNSVRLDLKRRSDGGRVIVDYVHLDLSDQSLRSDEAGRRWIERVSRHRVVTKAASHLMQRPFFSIVRDAILKHAPSLWQDETGIDYSELTPHFDITLYGDFTRAHRLWTAGVQRSLAQAYQQRDDVRPLPFRVGYEKASGSCVQVAVRRPSADPAP